MPLRPDLLAKRWSTFDLPILPCFAPRVFQPWPASCRPKPTTISTRYLHGDIDSNRAAPNDNDDDIFSGAQSLQAGAEDSPAVRKEQIEKERARRVSELILKHKNDLQVFAAQKAHEERESAERRRKQELEIIERRTREDAERMAEIHREDAERKKAEMQLMERRQREEAMRAKKEIELKERRKKEDDELKAKMEREEAKHKERKYQERALFLRAEAELKRLEDEMTRKLAVEEEKERVAKEDLAKRLQNVASLSPLIEDQLQTRSPSSPSSSNSDLILPAPIPRDSQEIVSSDGTKAVTLEAERQIEEFDQKFKASWTRESPRIPAGFAETKLAERLSRDDLQRHLAMNKRRQRRVRRPQILSARKQTALRKSYAGEYWYQRTRRSPPSAPMFHCRYEEWFRRFSLVSLRNRGFIRQKVSLIGYSTWIYPKALKDEYINSASSHSLQQAWRRIPASQRVRLWPELLITTLRDYPEKALKVLCGTLSSPYPPQRPFCDVLDFTIWHYLHSAHPADYGPAMELYKTIHHLFSKGPEDYVHLSQTSIYLLMTHLPGPRYVEEFYRVLDKSNSPLHHHTLMQFADQLAKAGGSFRDTAYEIMENIGSMSAVDWNTPQMLSLSTTLIMTAGEDTTYNHNKVFEFLISHGLRPNLITYNTLLYKTLNDGEPERGWQIYSLMKDHGVEPNVYTYSILLSDAKRRHDQPAIRHITNVVEEKSLWNPVIVTDILHIMFLEDLRNHEDLLRRNNMEDREPRSAERPRPFEKMLPIYCQYFKFEPLARLIPHLGRIYCAITKSDTLPTHIDTLLEPPSHVLTIMITALLRTYEDEYTPRLFYENFKKMVQNRDPVIATLAAKQQKHDKEHVDFRYVYNLILHAIGQFPKGISECVEILQAMSRPDPPLPQPDADGVVPYVPLRPPKPDDTTWNVMVTIFMKHRQARAAEKVIGMMKERGIEPTKVTWHRLLEGYTSMQETNMAVDVLERLTKSGLEVDKSTWRALRQLRDRRGLIDGMKRMERKRDEAALAQILAVQDTTNRFETDQEEKEKRENTPQDAEPGDFIVEDMKTKEDYRDMSNNLTVWRRLELFQGIDESVNGA